MISTTAFQVSETLMNFAKEMHWLNYYSDSLKMNNFLIQNINLARDIHDFFIS